MFIGIGEYKVGWSIPLASYNESHLVDYFQRYKYRVNK